MHSACGGLVRGNDINVNPTHYQEGQCHILYDATTVGQVTNAWFSPEYWQAQHAVIGQARGRGTTWFLRQANAEWVLRRYRRGGMMAPMLGDRYVWTGLRNTRAWREWRLLAQLRDAGLPVPAPIAVQVCRRGLLYRAAIMTRRIPDSQPLAQRLQQAALPAATWQAIGRCLRRFHLAGADHADLNAHNILLDSQDAVYVIDFDRGVLRAAGGAWQHANLHRLKRSLTKLARQYAPFNYDPSCFARLVAAYHAVEA
jgi:3-deoxy-D-manno-octulosonic acid kinase